ncbi:hypothetical protein BDB00DRAFT_14364 [Zychaea mexicana]|uniref:uncharacterized protein n=1 Tax=Zychaea mexicana TaxID=64656 RepID=UPI0022FE4402|nr:uncharacterized protein BDB00DRAFT_14364 [Zychaea mexicana]KAI9499733.1 hypothetical protein BDB00DRAFT_14364 [Zychaea mexicana]
MSCLQHNLSLTLPTLLAIRTTTTTATPPNQAKKIYKKTITVKQNKLSSPSNNNNNNTQKQIIRHFQPSAGLHATLFTHTHTHTQKRSYHQHAFSIFYFIFATRSITSTRTSTQPPPFLLKLSFIPPLRTPKPFFYIPFSFTSFTPVTTRKNHIYRCPTVHRLDRKPPLTPTPTHNASTLQETHLISSL